MNCEHLDENIMFIPPTDHRNSNHNFTEHKKLKGEGKGGCVCINQSL